jgi:WD40 repeat protein
MALTTQVAFINPKTGDLSTAQNCPDDATCLKFETGGSSLAVGTDRGELLTLSVCAARPVSVAHVFQSPILCCTWHNGALLSGTRDGLFGIFDPKSGESEVRSDLHQEELCSISFQGDSHLFATSSNDATVKIWDFRQMQSPISTYTEHSAAIRAVSWSPLSPGIIATGRGTSDKTIRIWNAETGKTIAAVDTGSQVCNLYWNDEYNELLSTHGFSQHQLALWRCADLSLLAQFYEHRQRVLFMSRSPDGTKVATAAPNDDLRIWRMFPRKRPLLSESMLVLR